MTATARQPAKTSARTAYPKVRRIRFPFGRPDPMRQHFVNDNIVLSHLIALLSGVFPPGEESFIRSVRRFSDDITDPVLKKRIAGFIGQEAVHGQEHRHLNEKLIEMQYPLIRLFDINGKRREDVFIRLETLLPRKAHLAATAAAEHYTAVLAEKVLSSNDIQAIPGDPQVWHLLNWHATEELEHKSVAFDTYRAVGGPESLRIGVMALLYALTIPVMSAGVLLSVATDPSGWRPLKLIRQTKQTFDLLLSDGLFRELAKYMKPGFHPDDIDTNGLLEQWQRELFGADGDLVGYIK